MSQYFLDSSALVKRYMPETGTGWVRQMTASASNNDIYVAQITVVEIQSAIARQFHDGHIDQTTLTLIRSLFERHFQREYLTLGLSASILQRSLDLLSTYRLRAYDATQLGTALELQARATGIGVQVTFVAADNRLLQAAVSEGLQTEDPNQHP